MMQSKTMLTFVDEINVDAVVIQLSQYLLEVHYWSMHYVMIHPFSDVFECVK